MTYNFYDVATRLQDAIMESVIEYPRPELSDSVWMKTDGDKYVLKQGVKAHILKVLSYYKSLNLLQSDEIRIVGSICSTNYIDSTDIDIHLIINKLPMKKTDQEWQTEIKAFFKENEESFKVGEHPIEVYLQLDESQDFYSDGLYDVLQDEWRKGPRIEKMDYDPYTVHKSIIDDIKTVVKDTDAIFAEMRRDTIDVKTIRDALAYIPQQEKIEVLKVLEAKLDELEENIRELLKNKQEWVKARKDSSPKGRTSIKQALEDLQHSKKWESQNVKFKLLVRYQYLRVITDLGKLLDDGEIRDNEIDTLQDILSGM